MRAIKKIPAIKTRLNINILVLERPRMVNNPRVCFSFL